MSIADWAGGQGRKRDKKPRAAGDKGEGGAGKGEEQEVTEAPAGSLGSQPPSAQGPVLCQPPGRATEDSALRAGGGGANASSALQLKEEPASMPRDLELVEEKWS